MNLKLITMSIFFFLFIVLFAGALGDIMVVRVRHEEIFGLATVCRC